MQSNAQVLIATAVGVYLYPTYIWSLQETESINKKDIPKMKDFPTGT